MCNIKPRQEEREKAKNPLQGSNSKDPSLDLNTHSDAGCKHIGRLCVEMRCNSITVVGEEIFEYQSRLSLQDGRQQFRPSKQNQNKCLFYPKIYPTVDRRSLRVGRNDSGSPSSGGFARVLGGEQRKRLKCTENGRDRERARLYHCLNKLSEIHQGLMPEDIEI